MKSAVICAWGLSTRSKCRSGIRKDRWVGRWGNMLQNLGFLESPRAPKRHTEIRKPTRLLDEGNERTVRSDPAPKEVRLRRARIYHLIRWKSSRPGLIADKLAVLDALAETLLEALSRCAKEQDIIPIRISS